jgi:hypothetical protein
MLMEHYQQMWPWLGGDDVVKAGGKSLLHPQINDHNQVFSALLRPFRVFKRAAGPCSVPARPVLRVYTIRCVYQNT